MPPVLRGGVVLLLHHLDRRQDQGRCGRVRRAGRAPVWGQTQVHRLVLDRAVADRICSSVHRVHGHQPAGVLQACVSAGLAACVLARGAARGVLAALADQKHRQAQRHRVSGGRVHPARLDLRVLLLQLLHPAERRRVGDDGRVQLTGLDALHRHRDLHLRGDRVAHPDPRVHGKARSFQACIDVGARGRHRGVHLLRADLLLRVRRQRRDRDLAQFPLHQRVRQLRAVHVRRGHPIVHAAPALPRDQDPGKQGVPAPCVGQVRSARQVAEELLPRAHRPDHRDHRVDRRQRPGQVCVAHRIFRMHPVDLYLPAAVPLQGVPAQLLEPRRGPRDPRVWRRDHGVHILADAVAMGELSRGQEGPAEPEQAAHTVRSVRGCANHITWFSPGNALPPSPP